MSYTFAMTYGQLAGTQVTGNDILRAANEFLPSHRQLPTRTGFPERLRILFGDRGGHVTHAYPLAQAGVRAALQPPTFYEEVLGRSSKEMTRTVRRAVKSSAYQSLHERLDAPLRLATPDEAWSYALADEWLEGRPRWTSVGSVVYHASEDSLFKQVHGLDEKGLRQRDTEFVREQLERMPSRTGSQEVELIHTVTAYLHETPHSGLTPRLRMMRAAADRRLEKRQEVQQPEASGLEESVRNPAVPAFMYGYAVVPVETRGGFLFIATPETGALAAKLLRTPQADEHPDFATPYEGRALTELLREEPRQGSPGLRVRRVAGGHRSVELHGGHYRRLSTREPVDARVQNRLLEGRILLTLGTPTPESGGAGQQE